MVIKATMRKKPAVVLPSLNTTVSTCQARCSRGHSGMTAMRATNDAGTGCEVQPVNPQEGAYACDCGPVQRSTTGEVIGTREEPTTFVLLK